MTKQPAPAELVEMWFKKAKDICRETFGNSYSNEDVMQVYHCIAQLYMVQLQQH